VLPKPEFSTMDEQQRRVPGPGSDGPARFQQVSAMKKTANPEKPKNTTLYIRIYTYNIYIYMTKIAIFPIDDIN
jgi:hypothetical protein